MDSLTAQDYLYLVLRVPVARCLGSNIRCWGGRYASQFRYDGEHRVTAVVCLHQVSTTHTSNNPLPLKSRNHWPVLGRNRPILAAKELVVWLLSTDCCVEAFDTVTVIVFSAVELFSYTARTVG